VHIHEEGGACGLGALEVGVSTASGGPYGEVLLASVLGHAEGFDNSLTGVKPPVVHSVVHGMLVVDVEDLPHVAVVGGSEDVKGGEAGVSKVDDAVSGAGDLQLLHGDILHLQVVDLVLPKVLSPVVELGGVVEVDDRRLIDLPRLPEHAKASC